MHLPLPILLERGLQSSLPAPELPQFASRPSHGEQAATLAAAAAALAEEVEIAHPANVKSVSRKKRKGLIDPPPSVLC